MGEHRLSVNAWREDGRSWDEYVHRLEFLKLLSVYIGVKFWGMRKQSFLSVCCEDQ